jgi:hypothetical protein
MEKARLADVLCNRNPHESCLKSCRKNRETSNPVALFESAFAWKYLSG